MTSWLGTGGLFSERTLYGVWAGDTFNGLQRGVWDGGLISQHTCMGFWARGWGGGDTILELGVYLLHV